MFQTNYSLTLKVGREELIQALRNINTELCTLGGGGQHWGVGGCDLQVLSSFVLVCWAAVTKHHGLTNLNSPNFISHSCGFGFPNPRPGCQQCKFHTEASSVGLWEANVPLRAQMTPYFVH